ncbi:DNA-binding protein [Pseudomonas viridiflava]|uniref:DNA-binding protein n=1 Tax=Pseudomonas viridiflava TaxID=33069 RepID=UPI000473B26A|nr:DNA-binding protein [Pseudomonas viridiflava]
MTSLRTHEEAKLWLDAQGMSVAEFCRRHDLDQFTTYQVLDGRKKGLRGKAHKAAVALGIKANNLQTDCLRPASNTT